MSVLRARLLLVDLLGLVVEGSSIVVPAYLLYGRASAEVRLPGTDVLVLGTRATWPVLLLLVLFTAAFTLWRHLWLRRLHACCAARGLSPVEETYVLASRLPRHSLVVRALLWLLCGVLYVAWLTWRGLPAGSQLPILWLFTLNPLLAGAVHNLLYDRLMWNTAWRPLGVHPSELRYFAGRYSVELARATLLSSAFALLCTAAFAASVPFDLEHFQRAQRYLPGLLLLLLYLGYRYASWSSRPIKRYLQAALGGGGADRQLARAAYQAAQSLPYRLGAAMVVSSLVAAVVLLGALRRLLDLPGESVLLILGVALSVTGAASLYAIIWHRYTLRTLLGHLRVQYPFRPDEIPAPLSLVGKMVYGFGLPVLCVCLLALLWSFVQYKTLANHHIQRMARDRLETLLDDFRRDLPASAAEVPARLAHVAAQAGLSRECFVYYLPAGRPEAVAVGAPPGAKAPHLPPYALVYLRESPSGQLDLPQLALTGAHALVPGPGAPPPGSVAVLYPNYRHPGFSGVRGAGAGAEAQPPGAPEHPLRGQLIGLIVFFAVLMFVSGGVVVVGAVDLTRPLRYLERRAAAMAEGDLTSPVVQTAVEVDEAGALAFAFEEMRRTLSEMLRSSTEMNLQLEAEVVRRTAELSRRNQEVSEAMNRLELARGELLRTEKLATMGRIAASITTEINNPVSAMVTIPDPLADELAELGRLVEERPLRRDRLAASLGELRKMTDVLHRSAQRAKEIVHATRVYTRLGDDKIGAFELGQAMDEVLQLFGQLPRWGVQVVRSYDEPLRVLAVRSDLGQLLSGWLARRAPRLREQPEGAELRITARRVRAPGPTVPGGPVGDAELVLADNGPPLPPAELEAAAGGVAGHFAGRLEVRSGPGATWLRLRLPLAQEGA